MIATLFPSAADVLRRLAAAPGAPVADPLSDPETRRQLSDLTDAQLRDAGVDPARLRSAPRTEVPASLATRLAALR